MAHVIPDLFGLALVAALGASDLAYRFGCRRRR